LDGFEYNPPLMVERSSGFTQSRPCRRKTKEFASDEVIFAN